MTSASFCSSEAEFRGIKLAECGTERISSIHPLLFHFLPPKRRVRSTRVRAGGCERVSQLGNYRPFFKPVSRDVKGCEYLYVWVISRILPTSSNTFSERSHLPGGRACAHFGHVTT